MSKSYGKFLRAASIIGLFLLWTGSAYSYDRPMGPSKGADSGRISKGELSQSDLIDAGDRGDDAEERVQSHLSAARRYLDVEAYEAAMEEIDAADRIIPFHEDVMDLLEVVGNLRDGARKAGMELSRIEEERRTRAAREELEKEESLRRENIADEVIARHRLSRDLERAIMTLFDREKKLEEQHRQARIERERCISAAAMAHAHKAGAQCRTEEEKMTSLLRDIREIDADIAVLGSAFRERKGEEEHERVFQARKDD